MWRSALGSPTRVLIAPKSDHLIEQAVRRGGATPVRDPGAAEAIIWLDSHPRDLAPLLRPHIRWVQLPSAGVAEWLDSGVIDDQRIFTSAAGAYADQVAEHALALIMAGRRRLATYARAQRWQPTDTRALIGSTVAIVGCGGIGRALIRLLQPFDVEVLAVNRSGDAVPGAARTLPSERTDEIWSQSDVAVLAAPATLRPTTCWERLNSRPCLRMPGSSTSPAGPWSTPRPSSRRWTHIQSPARPSTSPTPSRSRTATRCGVTPAR